MSEILNALQFDNQRAANIVRSLRSIFIENDLDTSKVNVNAIILTILDIVKPELKEKKIQIEYHVDPSLEIQITSSELRQVILNLVNNAIQALGNSATINPLISIDVSRHSGTVQIVTTDNGPGISKEYQANLFEILISTKQSGMGLGLWLCQYMITRHGGSIHYEDALGGGARFVIEIPHSA